MKRAIICGALAAVFLLAPAAQARDWHRGGNWGHNQPRHHYRSGPAKWGHNNFQHNRHYRPNHRGHYKFNHNRHHRPNHWGNHRSHHNGYNRPAPWAHTNYRYGR